MTNSAKYLVVIAGPTAVGKTDIAIQLASSFKTEVISADSRQFYREMSIGTAKPDQKQLKAVKHHFIGQLSVSEYYNVSVFENEVLKLLENLFLDNNIVFIVGGSGLYIDAVCNGIDDFPDPPPEIRNNLKGILAQNGIVVLQEMLQHLDPEYYAVVDIQNPNRLLRALEVCQTTGLKFSELRSNSQKKRDFNIVKIGLNLPRAQLFNRIGLRVDKMIGSGLINEVESLMSSRQLNALKTVGYKEIFEFLDLKITLEKAIENIKTNTRRYAKRQLTWFTRTDEYKWFDPNDVNEIANYLSLICK